MKDQQIIQSTRNGETLAMHRCVNCWQVHRFAHEDGQPIAIDNGFFPMTKDYPHADWCKNRGLF